MVARQIQKDMENASWIRKMFEEGDRLKKLYGAGNVYDFSLGNPDAAPPAGIAKSFAKYAVDGSVHKYMPNAGFADVRSAVAEKLSKESGLAFTMDNIVMSVGAAGGMNAALKALLDPGDEVIADAPYFAEYRFYVQNHGGRLVPVPARRGSFRLDIDAISAAINEKTKAILLNSPNNPTGVIYGRQELSELAEVLRARRAEFGTGLCILSDEPYIDISYGSEIPNMFTIYDDVIVINSFSKSLSLPGGRIGYVAVSPEFSDLKNMTAALSFTTRTLGYVNAPGIYQKVIMENLYARVDVDAYRKRRDMLHGVLTRAGIECALPEGAFYLFAKSPVEDDVQFVQAAAKHRILVVPGVGFGCPGYFRAAYCVDERVIRDSESSFCALMKEMKG